MKTISNLLFALALLASPVFAQPPEVGFLRIVNAIAPGTGNATFQLNGRNLYQDGYQLGQNTGGYGVKAGDLRIVVRKEGVGSGTTRIQIKTGETTTLIAFAERLPAKNANNLPRWKIKLLRLKQQDAESGYRLSFVSVCQSDETVVQVTFEGRKPIQRISARRLAITQLDIGKKQIEMTVGIGDRKLTHISTDSPGNYVVILYENAEGVLQALSFYDPRFVVAG